MDGKRRKVLVVGQTPPPLNGQTIMIQALLDGRYDGLDLHHARLNFSRSTDEIGTFQTRKLYVLLKTLLAIFAGRWKTHAQILYYPPAGPTLNPVLRDIFLLIGTRWLFKYTVFHFHAAGLLEIYPQLPRWLKPFFNLAYRNADLAIFTTESTASTGAALKARKVSVIANGIQDNALTGPPILRNTKRSIPRILFVGILCKGKGLLTLIDACTEVQKSGLPFHLSCVGAFDSEDFRRQVEDLIQSRGLTGVVSFPGVLSGEKKAEAFREADIFCYPSHYHAESFGLVLIEAMSYGLPIVTTNWRGIPEVVAGSGGALIVEPEMPNLLAEELMGLLRDGNLRVRMGANSRAWFAGRYTLEQYRSRMQKALENVGRVGVEDGLESPEREMLMGGRVETAKKAG